MASKVSGIIEKIQPGGSSGTSYAIASTAYGYCETAAGTAAKVVDMTDFKLYEGVTIHVKFANANSADNPTLNVNSTGAKAIVQYGTTAAGKTSDTNGWYAGAVLTLTYDGTSWVRDQGYNSDNAGITSVTIGATSPVQSSTSTAQTGSSASTTISLKDAYGDTKNPYGAKAMNLVLAGPPSGNNAAPSFRALVAADIPDIGDTYLKLSGGTMTGDIKGNASIALGTTANPFHNIVLGGATSNTLTADSTNPRITFQESNNGSQPVHLIYTDYDSYRAPAGLKIIGGTSASPAWLEVEGNVYAAAFKGHADSATSANYINLYEGRGTTTTLNKAANYIGAGKMFHLVASSSTSATDNGKTPTDANILQMNWDNNGGYDAQLGIATGANRMYFRSRPSQKIAWDEVAHAPVGTAGVGNVTQPVYMTSEGVITAGTALKALAYKDSLTYSDVGAAPAVTGGYLPLSGGTLTGALTTANGTWNTMGDDAYFGDINKAGHIGIKGKNGNTGLFFTTYNQSSNQTGGAITWDGTKFSITSTTAVAASISGNAATATDAANTQSNYGAKSFIVEGDADTYYPVVISGYTSHGAWTLLNISRDYAEQAPDTWNTSTHKGGLVLTILSNGNSAWDGNHSIGIDKLNTIIDLSQQYSIMVADMQMTNFGLVIWLRGGSAKYWITSNGGQSVTATPKYEEYTASSNTVAPRTDINTARLDNFRWNNLWTIKNATNATAATTATKFASAQSITLTGDVTGTASSQAGWSLATTIGTGKVTNTMLAGSIANNKLTNSKVTIAGNDISLGGSLAASTLVTSLGLSKAMRFIGVATVAITDGSTTDPVISGYSTKTAGDVIIDKDSSREYVWSTAGKWELLGGDESYWVSSTDTTAKFWRGDNTWSDTISGGTLKITNNGNTVTIGSANSSWAHFTNSVNRPFYFSNKIHANGGFQVYNSATSLTDNNLTFSQGGGWSMSDATWIRTVGSKSVYMNAGTFRNDGTTQLRSLVHVNTNIVDDGSWLGTTGTAPTATTTDGTTTYSDAVIGTSVLTIGNNKVGANSASGVANNSKGYLRIFGAGSGYAELTYNDSMFASTKSIYLTNTTNSGINNEIRGLIATNDYWRVAGGATASNAGYMEIATADDSNEPIYVRQYTGVFTTLKRTATLLDASGNTEFPVQVTAPKFIGALQGNADTATTATNLANNPSIQTSNNTQVTITAGGKTSSAYTVPYATKTTGANITSTAYGVAYYSNTTGTFASTTAGAEGDVFIGKETGQGAITTPTWYKGLNLLGTSSANWTATFGGAVYVDKTITIASKVTLQWNATDQSLDFVFA